MVVLGTARCSVPLMSGSLLPVETQTAGDPGGTPQLYAVPRCWDFTLEPSESHAGFLDKG